MTVSNLIRFLFVKNYLETLKPQALYQRLQINQDCGFFFLSIICIDINDSIEECTMKGVGGVN